MTNAPLLIHIGLHKTASSWLQECLFAPPHGAFETVLSRNEVIRWLVLPNAFSYDAARIRGVVSARVRSLREGCVPVITHELLSGNPRRAIAISRVLADRLAETFPEGRVVMVFREQRAILLSWYKHHVRAGSPTRLADFAQPYDEMLLHEPPFRLDYFEYDRILSYYRQLFGPERVHAEIQERLVAEASAALARLLVFAGAPRMDVDGGRIVNPSLSPSAVLMKRLLNRFNPRPMTEPDRNALDRLSYRLATKLACLVPAGIDRAIETRWARVVEQLVGDCFVESNRRLAGLMGVELAKYGYRVAPVAPLKREGAQH